MNTASTGQAATTDLAELLPQVIHAATQAGDRLMKAFSPDSRPTDRAAMYKLGMQIESESATAARTVLNDALPGAGWVEEEQEGSLLPKGDWWVVDGAEGGVNHVHGLPEWGVTITLIRDNAPVLAVVRQPVGDLTYTAVQGGGAKLNGRSLRASGKAELEAAIVAASQAGGDVNVSERFGRAVAALSQCALLVRNTIPTTFPLLAVASGQYDVFWQYEPDLPGVSAGSLLVSEAGGIVTDLRGRPWTPGSRDVLISAPGLHAAALAVLSPII
ncbi:inositol monophosphatase family protein [Streptomyces sp. NPDC051576]|uniref:inositol monophosphatase family protein n=1 Tax=Streptomyces sp. NPDC051576 TaxID=3155803 RepID=UPI00342E79D9